MNKLATTTTEAETTTTTPATTTTTEAPFECPAPDGNFPVAGQCSPRYYICVGGLPYPQACPAGTYFDPITLKCASAATVSCLGTFHLK